MTKMKKIIFITIILFGIGNFIHFHDEKCGYNPLTKEECCCEIKLYQDQGPAI